MSDYGITPEEFPGMAKLARTAVGVLFDCDPIPLTDDDIIKIFTESYQ